jgi:hypothetical protein
LLNTTASWKVVHWDCSNVGPPKKLNRLNGHTVLASLSANSEYTSKEWDQGLAFPRYRSYDLSTSQREGYHDMPTAAATSVFFGSPIVETSSTTPNIAQRQGYIDWYSPRHDTIRIYVEE